MGDSWSVKTEKLKASAKAVEDKTQLFEKEWKKLYSEVSNLKTKQWNGIASDTFNTKIDNYKSNFENVTKILREYANALAKIADDYEKTEEKNNEDAGKLPTGK